MNIIYFFLFILILSFVGSLDFDEGPKSYSLSIFASDGILAGITTLNVQITDVNDIAPVVTNSDLFLAISESTPGGILFSMCIFIRNIKIFSILVTRLPHNIQT